MKCACKHLLIVNLYPAGTIKYRLGGADKQIYLIKMLVNICKVSKLLDRYMFNVIFSTNTFIHQTRQNETI